MKKLNWEGWQKKIIAQCQKSRKKTAMLAHRERILIKVEDALSGKARLGLALNADLNNIGEKLYERNSKNK